MREYVERLHQAWAHEWRPRTLVTAHVGSLSHGTHLPSTDPESIDDVDVMWIFQPARRFVYGLERFEHWTPPAGPYDELEIIGYSVAKLTGLLVKANPNVMGLLWLPDRAILQHHPTLRPAWIHTRDAFLSRVVFDSFVRYAIGQLRRAGYPNHMGRLGRERKEQFQRFGYSPKNAAHCLRLLRMGIELAEIGEMNVDRSGIDAEEIQSIKRGEWRLSQIDGLAEKGLAKMNALRATTALPERPDRARIEQLLYADCRGALVRLRATNT